METNEVHFIYDGNVVIQERDVNNNPLVTYTRGNDLSGMLQGAGGIGGLLARTDYGQEIPGSPTAAYYHADGNGNVTMLIYTNQTIAAKYLYDPFGNTLSLSGPLAGLNAYRFSSKEWNVSAGLYYYLYRFYDPNLQRWPNSDPLGELGFEIIRKATKIPMRVQEPNLYKFVYNNPINYLDVNGLDKRLTQEILGSAKQIAKACSKCPPEEPEYLDCFTYMAYIYGQTSEALYNSIAFCQSCFGKIKNPTIHELPKHP